MTASKKLIQAAAGNVAGGDFYPYTIDNSARFDGSSYLSKTLANSDGKKWTVSFWYKPSDITANIKQHFLEASSGAALTNIHTYNNQMTIEYYSAPNNYYIRTAAIFRDPSSWYHIVIVFDTANATSTDRMIIYVNGIRQTNFAVTSYPPQNTVGHINTSLAHNIGRLPSGYNFKGYLAEYHFIDGTVYDASAFGESKNGVWIPKSPSVTYGTNGFYLAFQDSSNLGNDVSGNNNDFTSSGLTSSDQMTDTPTNNFPTWNPLLSGLASGTPTLSNGNLDVLTPGAGSGHAYATMAIPESGDWYWEVTWNTGTYWLAGIAEVDRSTVYSPLAKSIMYHSNGFFYEDATSHTGYTAASTGDVVGIRANVDAGTVSFYLNNTLLDTFTYDVKGMFPQTGDASGTPGVNTISATGNFGQSSFTYTPPGTSVALCTANLPEPTIGPNSATQSDENFAPVLYTGNGTAIGSGGKTISDLEFQPDFTWIKNRDATDNHMLFDAVRTATKYLSSNLTNAEATDTESLTSFTSTGFTLGNNVAVNTNTEDYVAWNWKANGSGVSNTDGTITSTVSANTDAGFSIVTYTGTGVESAETIGHGLGVAPKVVITKSRDATPAYNWNTYHYGVDASAPEDWFVALNNNAARVSYTAADIWNRTQPTSSVVHVNSILASGGSSDRIVFYCFAEVEGFSKFGKYTGNGNADGPFVYTGFRPAWVMVKRTDSSTGGSWAIRDSARNPENPLDVVFYSDGSNADADWSSYPIDFLSNGFKIRASNSNQNASGSPYIFMAFAENPFKYANAR